MQCVDGVEIIARSHLKDQGLDMSIILKRILRKSKAKDGME
jgi:hypothetical protein